jgi:hypothetical protein
MTSRGSGPAPRTYLHQERSTSLQLLPRSIPTRPQSPTRSAHHRSHSLSRYPRFEECLVDEKSRLDAITETSPAKSEASTSRVVAQEPLSLRHQSRPSSAASLRRSTSHHCSASPDSPPSPIPLTTPSHFALPLPSLHAGYLHPPRKIRLCSIIKPWLPVLAYLSTSLGFLIAIAFWKTQVFQGECHATLMLSPFAPSGAIFGGSVVRLRLSVYVHRFGQLVQLAQG